MTIKQRYMIDAIKSKHMEMKQGGYPNPEFKRFDVKEDGKWTFVISEIGSKGDEGTMAEILCRDKRHIMIGPNGGVRLLNGKNKEVVGLFKCICSLIER